jgi:predicted AlkP superfamily phosphohydrolase/phosphomutase
MSFCKNLCNFKHGLRSKSGYKIKKDPEPVGTTISGVFPYPLTLLIALALIFIVLMGQGCSESKGARFEKKMIVLGFDGLDPQLLSEYMRQGLLPNFSKLSRSGDFKPLGTSIPPQSPVAWSNFITGMNPGGHGIFDFIHRDPETMLPISSTTKTEGTSSTISVGDWVIPLAGGEVKLLRQGRAFWEILEDKGVPTTIFRVPANFPPVASKGKSLSGMGTPDLLGSYGTFSYYTDDPPENRADISGGVVYPVEVLNNGIDAKLVGPKNAFRKGEPDAVIPFKVWRDPEYPTAKITIQNHRILLREKEWSDWIPVEFELIPGLQSVTGICRFYLKEVRPNFKLYVTPVNIDPSNPALPISTPSDFASDLYRDCGYFYTQGMPEDTKALSWGVFDHEDFYRQSENVLQERIRLFDYAINHFKEGLLFFYVSSTDQKTHMFWNMIDPEHPTYDSTKAEKFGKVIQDVYVAADSLVGKTLEAIDETTTLLVMSDHGFAPFRRAVHLNSWLKNEGYLQLIDATKQGESDYFSNVDWPRTKVYGLGFNGLYVNLMGREKHGMVARNDVDALLKEITEKLLTLRDPENGNKIVEKIYRAHEVYSGENVDRAPDLVIGYSRGYRASWETTIGKIPREWIGDNLDAWSGDHCMAAELVPGILLSNKKLQAENPKLFDLAPTILAAFGIDKSRGMVGNSVFE